MISATQTMIQTYTCSVKLRTHTSPQETRSPSETNHKLPGKYMVFVSFLTHVFLCFVGSTHVVSIGVFSMLHKCLFLSVSSFANTWFFSCFGAPVRKFGKVWMGFSPRLSTAGKLSCCPRCWERTATVQEILEAHLSLRDGLRMVGLAARSQQQDGAGRKTS